MMTIDEVINVIDRLIDDSGIYGNSELSPHTIEALILANRLLEKQKNSSPDKVINN